MSSGGDRLHLDRLAAGDVDSILGWRYRGEYSAYDLDAGDRATLVDAGNGYLVVRCGAELIGFICLGSEARVSGMTQDRSVVDLGVGIRPDLTGRGESRRLMPAILTALDRRLGVVTFCAVIEAWNHRAQRAAAHAGFRVAGTHENSAGEWVLLVRPPARDV
jgi:[ribosomal protein S18]-alanine N-acetyltransferase